MYFGNDATITNKKMLESDFVWKCFILSSISATMLPHSIKILKKIKLKYLLISTTKFPISISVYSFIFTRFLLVYNELEKVFVANLFLILFNPVK